MAAASSSSPPATQTELLREVSQLRAVLKQHPELYRSFYEQEARDALGRTAILAQIPERTRNDLAALSKRVEYPAGSLIVRQGVFDLDDHIVAIVSGEVKRWESRGEGRTHTTDVFDPNSIGTLHLYTERHAATFNAECVTDVVVYLVPREAVRKAIRDDPEAAERVLGVLAEHMRHSIFETSTPLFDQRTQPGGTSITATTLGACVEAFYRSAMNNLINERLTGVRGPFFPKMHIQIPARIVYLNGMKQIRFAVQERYSEELSRYASFRALASFLPGVMMTPFASFLEAMNAGQNKVDPLWRKPFRGVVPRVGREIVFGLGINQLADFYSQQARFIPHPFLQQAAGSISAGMTAGFLSHVPHSLSVLKLQNPTESYGTHWKALYTRYDKYVPPTVTSPMQRKMAMQAMTVLLPIGLLRRCAQIAGAFTIINGTTYALRHQNWP